MRDYDRAIRDFDQAIKINPNFILAFNDRGLAYVVQGRDRSRHPGLRPRDPARPEDALAFNNRGLAYRNKGETDAAINNYDQAILINPEFALAYYNRGNAYYDKRDYDRAIQDYDQAIKINPNYALAYYDRGVVYYDRHDYERAVADLSKAIKLDPKDSLAYYNRGLTYRAKGEMDSALADFDQAIKLDPKNPLPFYNRGLASRDKGDHERADRRLQPPRSGSTPAMRWRSTTAVWPTGIGASPTARWPDYDRRSGSIRATRRRISAAASRYFEKRDYDRAIADLNQAINGRPNYPLAFNIRGLAYNAKGETDRAIQDFDQAIRLDPKFAVALQQPRRDLSSASATSTAPSPTSTRRSRPIRITTPPIYNRGLAYRDKRDFERALADFRPGDQARSEERGGVQQPRLRPTGTRATTTTRIADFDQAIKLDPKFAAAYTNRGNALLREARLRPRHRRLRPGDQVQPEQSPASGTIAAWRYRDKGDNDRAIADFDQAIKLDRKFAAAFASRGLAHSNKRDYTRALADLDNAHPAGCRVRRRVQRPRHRPCRDRQDRPRDRGLHPGDPASIRTTTPPSTTAAWPIAAKGEIDRAIEDFDAGDQGQPEL